MKTIIIGIIALLLATLMLAIIAVGFGKMPDAQKVANTKEQLLEKYTLTPDKLVADLQTRFTIVPPGQVWAFSPDQKVFVKILQIRQVDDNAVAVAVNLAATAVIPAQAKESKKLITVHLSGVAKMNYELIAGEWYLLDITSVTLRASQK